VSLLHRTRRREQAGVEAEGRGGIRLRCTGDRPFSETGRTTHFQRTALLRVGCSEPPAPPPVVPPQGMWR
jgi:hypothetical protein